MEANTRTWDDLLGQTVAGRYRLSALASKGEDQAEYLAEGPAGPVTITLIAASEEDAPQILAEMEKARQLRHPNLLEIFDNGREDHYVYLVAETPEYALAGRLQAGPPLGAPEAHELLTGMLAALEFLHSRNLACGALEPQAIVRAGGRWKVADLSRAHPLANPGADIGALGQVLREVLGPNPPEPFPKILEGCSADSRRRWTIARIRQELEPVASRAAVPYRRLVVAAGAIFVAALGFWTWHRATSSSEPAPPPLLVNKPKPVPQAPAGPPPQKPSPLQRPKIQRAERTADRIRIPVPAAPRAVEPERPPEPSGSGEETGRADFFTSGPEGHGTASGERVTKNDLVAAHAHYPFGTRLRVTNLRNGKSVVVRVVERRSSGGRILSVSEEAARQLGFLQSGWANVSVSVVK